MDKDCVTCGLSAVCIGRGIETAARLFAKCEECGQPYVSLPGYLYPMDSERTYEPCTRLQLKSSIFIGGCEVCDPGKFGF